MKDSDNRNDTDEKIINLETKSAYQEHLIQELNEVVIGQQHQIDNLEKSLAQFKSILQQNAEHQPGAEQEAPPPHY